MGHLVVLSLLLKNMYVIESSKFKPVLFKCSYVYEEIYVYEESLALITDTQICSQKGKDP